VTFQRALLVAGKGGVGKTTLAILLAFHWVRAGKEVGLLDANLSSPDVPVLLGLESQGIEGLMEGIEPAEPMEGLKVVSMGLFLHRPSTPVTWRGPIRHGVLRQFLQKTRWGKLDLLVVDLPPGIGEELLSLVHLLRDKARGLLVATDERLSQLELKRLCSFFEQARVPVVGWVQNRSSGEGEIKLPVAKIASLPSDPQLREWRGGPLKAPLSRTIEEIASHCEEAMAKTAPPVTVTARLLYNLRRG